MFKAWEKPRLVLIETTLGLGAKYARFCAKASVVLFRLLLRL